MEELINQTTEETVEESNQMYLDAINDLKSKSVSKDKYDKLVEENRNLLQSIVNGQSAASAEEPTEELPSKEELVKAMTSGTLSADDYVKAALTFRDIIFKETGKDVFVASGHYIQPSNDAQASAERTADVFAQCLESSSGNSTEFVQKLQNRTNDVRIPGCKY